MQTGTKAHDQGIYLGRDTLGARRRKVLLYLIKHPEFDADDVTGELTFHMAGQGMVKATFHPRPVELQDLVA